MTRRIVHVERGGEPARAGLVPGPGLTADGVVRRAVRDAEAAHACEHRIELGARQREREVLAAIAAPRRELEHEVVADADDRERAVASGRREAHHVDVEAQARRQVADL